MMPSRLYCKKDFQKCWKSTHFLFLKATQFLNDRASRAQPSFFCKIWQAQPWKAWRAKPSFLEGMASQVELFFPKSSSQNQTEPSLGSDPTLLTILGRGLKMGFSHVHENIFPWIIQNCFKLWNRWRNRSLKAESNKFWWKKNLVKIWMVCYGIFNSFWSLQARKQVGYLQNILKM